MSPAPPPADPDNGLGELFDLWSAPNADALHRVLVLRPPARGSADAFEPFALLQQHHESESESSLTTALLLLTDQRWRNGVARLVRRIAESSILDAEQLDLLARTLIAAADAVYWQVPDEWFAGGEHIVIELDGAEPDGTDDDGSLDVDQGPVVARRDVFPPLRRWAAAHLVAREPAGWSALWRRAGELDARSGAAVAAGLLDRVDVLTPQAQAFVVKQATSWPDHTVRRLALEFVAAHDGPKVAARLGRNDPNARLRAWAASLVVSAEAQPPAGPAPAPRAGPAPAPRREPPEQSTLF
jgi:hypothetical protein